MLTQDRKLINVHKFLRYDLFCQKEENMHACDDEDASVVGPIKLDETSKSQTQPVFYLANQSSLNTDRYEFHKSRKSQVADSSYIYMLYEIQNVTL